MIMCTVQLLRLKFTVTVSNSFEFFSPFFFLYALQGERIKDIKKKKKVLASNFIHVREKDNYRHCRLLFP